MVDGGVERFVRQRPRAATWACLVLTGCGVLGVADAVAALAIRRHFDAAAPIYANAVGAAGISNETLLAPLSADLWATTWFAIAAAVLLIPLGLALSRPWHRAKLLALCAAGLFLADITVSIIAVPDVSRVADPTEPTDLLALRTNLIPIWFPSFHQLTLVAIAAGLIAVIVLLMRESASDYYRHWRSDLDPRKFYSYSRPLDG
jgi:hypothetical protein